MKTEKYDSSLYHVTLQVLELRTALLFLSKTGSDIGLLCVI
jgi:hypothetical protein